VFTVTELGWGGSATNVGTDGVETVKDRLFWVIVCRHQPTVLTLKLEWFMWVYWQSSTSVGRQPTVIPVPQPICEEEQGVGRSPGIAKEPRTSRQSNPAKVLIVLS